MVRFCPFGNLLTNSKTGPGQHRHRNNPIHNCISHQSKALDEYALRKWEAYEKWPQCSAIAPDRDDQQLLDSLIDGLSPAHQSTLILGIDPGETYKLGWANQTVRKGGLTLKRWFTSVRGFQVKDVAGH